MDLHLRGKTVLVTGASKGIGAAIAETFAEEGANLHLAARNTESMRALADRLRSAHQVNVTVHTTDLRSGDDLKRVASDTAGIDILVNNAGDIPGGSLEQIDETTWRHAWELKVFGYINLTRLVHADMKRRGGGVIVNIIGAAAEWLDYDYIAGSTGNAALVAFTKTLGRRTLHYGVRVVGINPGPVATDRIVSRMKRQAAAKFGDEARYAELFKDMPLGRAATPREIADMTAFLASDRSAYTSGSVVTIEGAR
jgi:NAD(P)-dependent dehydrogenase (short-subunit alcohol dehydrogenase family)